MLNTTSRSIFCLFRLRLLGYLQRRVVLDIAMSLMWQLHGLCLFLTRNPRTRRCFRHHSSYNRILTVLSPGAAKLGSSEQVVQWVSEIGIVVTRSRLTNDEAGKWRIWTVLTQSQGENMFTWLWHDDYLFTGSEVMSKQALQRQGRGRYLESTLPAGYREGTAGLTQRAVHG